MDNFAAFASAYGLVFGPRDPIADGRWHRTSTTDKRRSKKNGAYKFLGDVGFVINHATMGECAVFRPDGPEIRIDRAEMRRRMRQARKEEAERHARVALEAQMILEASELVTPVPAVPARGRKPAQEAVLAHPYLIKKGLHDVPGLVYHGSLIVPMRVNEGHYQKLVNVQRIFPDGEKRFLTGGRAKDAFHRIGPPRAKEVWLVEGYATAWSLLKALKAMYRDAAVVVCFSAGNLKYPGATHVFADNDESAAGQRAAEATGLPWVMPTEVGMDANDVYVKHGLRALQELVRGVRSTG